MYDNVSPIPIGFENRRFMNNERLKNLKKFNKQFNHKENNILASFNQHTNLHFRKELINNIKVNSKVKIEMYEDHFSYMSALKSFNFSLCPRAMVSIPTGFGNHRKYHSDRIKKHAFTKFYEMEHQFYL